MLLVVDSLPMVWTVRFASGSAGPKKKCYFFFRYVPCCGLIDFIVVVEVQVASGGQRHLIGRAQILLACFGQAPDSVNSRHFWRLSDGALPLPDGVSCSTMMFVGNGGRPVGSRSASDSICFPCRQRCRVRSPQVGALGNARRPVV